tara:strand:- start:191 stop:364 length:174 start_codon:yes stop_codon:yes gene_type:complete
MDEYEVNWPLVGFLLMLMIAPLGLNLALVKPGSLPIVGFLATVIVLLFRCYYVAYHA